MDRKVYFDELPLLTSAQISEVSDLVRTSSIRRERKRYVLEGEHLMQSAIACAPSEIDSFLITSSLFERIGDGLIASLGPLQKKLKRLPEKAASKISDTSSATGIFTVMRMRGEGTLKISDGLTIALDGLQDPGNLGTIVRSAAWFGVKNIILGKGTVDYYNPKVIRSTQGALFLVDVQPVEDLIAKLKDLRRHGAKIMASTSGLQADSVYDFDFPKRSVLVIGSESKGIGSEVLKVCDHLVTIPRGTDASDLKQIELRKISIANESLNAGISAAIMMNEFARSRLSQAD